MANDRMTESFCARRWWVEMQRDRRGLTFGWTEKTSPIGAGALWLSVRWGKKGRGVRLNSHQLRVGLGLASDRLRP